MQRNNQTSRGRHSTPLSDLDPALTEISRKVIGCAIETHKELGPGYPLEIYRKALLYELKHEEVSFEENKEYEVEFDGEVIGSVFADLYAGDRFLVKIMAESYEVGGKERNELRATLRAADLELGLIINFGQRRLKDGLVRVLNPDALRSDDDQSEYEDEEDAEYAEAAEE
ncbi:MAG: GxxExxY protein [Phycisphaerales bacterium]|nr:GxxExxY protein [Phycisphaerales bacterium]